MARVAELQRAGGSLRICKRGEATMDDLEAALWPALPIETVRIGGG